MTITRTNSNDAGFCTLVAALDKDLSSRYEERQAIYDQYNKVPDLPTVIVIWDEDIPVACGAFKYFDAGTVEIKRMFVAPDYRGRGLATAVLNELEEWAAALQNHTAVLETGTRQHEAIALYQKLGYTIIPNYGQYVGMDTSICMQKSLV